VSVVGFRAGQGTVVEGGATRLELKIEIMQAQDDGFVSSVPSEEIFQPMSLKTK
jgi:hypothetical protein